MFAFKAYSLSAITDTLRHMSQIQTLELKLRLVATVNEMDYLHEQLPRLKDLYVDLTEAHVDDVTLSLSEFEAIRPAKNMQSFMFHSDIWSHRPIFQSYCLKYILTKYPRLKQLGLYHSDGVGHTGFTDEIATTATDTIVTMHNHFSELQSICLGLLAGHHSMTWPNLFRDIPKINLCGVITSNTFPSWIKSDATSQIKRLVLKILSTSISQIGHCTHIKPLVLNGSFPTEEAYQELPLGTILSECKSLEIMDMPHCIIHSTRVSTSESYRSSLKTLTLTDTLFITHDSLTYIGIQCLQLTHLELDRCAWRIRADVPIIQIHMPLQWFTYIEIVKPMIFSEYIKTDGAPFQQAWYRPLEYNQVTNEYFMMKIPVEGSSMDISYLVYNVINWSNPFNNMRYNSDLWTKHGLQLINARRCNTLFRIALSKIIDFDVKE